MDDNNDDEDVGVHGENEEVKNIPAWNISDTDMHDLSDAADNMLRGGAIKKMGIDRVKQEAIEFYHLAEQYGRCNAAAVWRTGERLKIVFNHYMGRKAEIKASGDKFRDEPDNWTSWLKAADISPQSAGRYIRVYERNQLKDIIKSKQRLMDLAGYESTELSDNQYLENPRSPGTILRLDHSVKLLVKGQQTILPEKTCFEVTDTSILAKDGFGNSPYTNDKGLVQVKIRTGKHKGSIIDFPVGPYLGMTVITESEIKDPPAPPKKGRTKKTKSEEDQRSEAETWLDDEDRREAEEFLDAEFDADGAEDEGGKDDLGNLITHINNMGGTPKPTIFQPDAIDVNKCYVLTADVTEDDGNVISKGTYVAKLDKVNGDKYLFTVFSGAHSGQEYSADISKNLGYASSLEVAKKWFETTAPPPACFHVEVNLALAFLQQAREVLSKTKAFTPLESVFLYQWKSAIPATPDPQQLSTP
jgi:hypothetical protein